MSFFMALICGVICTAIIVILAVKFVVPFLDRVCNR